MSKSVQTIIQELGGPTKVSAFAGVTPGAVRMWKKRNRIPRTAWPDLLDASKTLTLADLRAMERAA